MKYGYRRSYSSAVQLVLSTNYHLSVMPIGSSWICLIIIRRDPCRYPRRSCWHHWQAGTGAIKLGWSSAPVSICTDRDNHHFLLQRSAPYRPYHAACLQSAAPPAAPAEFVLPASWHSLRVWGFADMPARPSYASVLIIAVLPVLEEAATRCVKLLVSVLGNSS